MNAVATVKDVLLTSGAGWILGLLGLLSAVSIGIIIERTLFFRTRRGDLSDLTRRLDDELRAGRFAEAIAMLEKSPSVASSIAIAGLRLADRGAGSAEKGMRSASAVERGRLEQGLSYLGTIGNNAPFVGLFGTVVGIIHAFEELGHGAPGHGPAGAAGPMASQAVMGAIAEALVATAVGILVALPAVAAYNHFQRKVVTLLGNADVTSNLVLAYLSSAPAAAPAPSKEAVPHGGV